MQKLDALLASMQSGRQMGKEALIDVLKFVFNLLLQYPRMKHAATQNQSGDGEEKKPAPVIGDLWEDKFSPCVSVSSSRDRMGC